MHLSPKLIKLAACVAVLSLLLSSLSFFPQGLIFAADTDPTDNIGNSDLEDQLEEIERQLARIRQSQKDMRSRLNNEQSRAGNYSGKIGVLGAQVESVQLEIAEIELQIEELNVNIKILEDMIETKQAEIASNEKYVADLEEETSDRITNNYINFRLNRRLSQEFFRVQDANSYFKDAQYKEIIQADTNRTLSELITMKEEMEKDKAQLEEAAVKVLRDKEIVDEQHSQLEREKQDLKAQMDGYYGALYVAQKNISNTRTQLAISNKREAKKMAEAEKIRQQIFNSFNSIPNGKYVVKGTRIGNQGNTGWSTGPHLHFSVAVGGVTRNPCAYLPSGVISGCGSGGSLEWPLKGSFYYTSRYYSGVNGDLRCFYYGGKYTCYAHPAIDIAHSVWNAPVYAAHDGWLFKGVDQYGALYIVICQNKDNCNNGYKTGYWHLSKY